MDPNAPDLHALVITIGYTVDMITRHAPTTEWNALEGALVDEHSPEQLARMLVAASAIIARARGSAPIL